MIISMTMQSRIQPHIIVKTSIFFFVWTLSITLYQTSNLYDVLSYWSKDSFVKDKDKHFAGSNYDKPKYGFLVNQAKRFDIPIPIRGKLGFFNFELNGFRLEAGFHS